MATIALVGAHAVGVPSERLGRIPATGVDGPLAQHWPASIRHLTIPRVSVRPAIYCTFACSCPKSDASYDIYIYTLDVYVHLLALCLQ